MIYEIDMDGVLVDTHSYVELRMREYDKDFLFSAAKRYKIEENNFPLETVNMLYYWFSNEETFANAPLMVGARELLEKIVSKGDEIIIHSMGYSIECIRAKAEFLATHFKGINYSMCLDLGRKTMLESDVVIEDSLENLSNSCSKKKILIDRFYNQESYNGEYANLFNSIERVSSLLEI